MTQERPQITSGVTASAPRDPCTSRILQAFFNTYNEHGWGYLETVYRRALVVELQYLGAAVSTEVKLPIFHRGVNVGDYFADVIVDDRVIVECKTAERIAQAHRFQITNYLKATKYEVGLILNFGQSPTFERRVFSNDRKHRRDAQ